MSVQPSKRDSWSAWRKRALTTPSVGCSPKSTWNAEWTSRRSCWKMQSTVCPTLFNYLHVSCVFCYSQLMTKEPLEKLGFKDLKDSSPKQADWNTKLWQPAVKGGVSPMWQVHQCFNWWNHKDCCMKRGNNCYNEDIVVLTGAFKATVAWKLFCKWAQMGCTWIYCILSCQYFMFKVCCAQNYSIVVSVYAHICEDPVMLSRKATGGMQAKIGLLSIIFVSPIEIDNKTYI